jgi:hypothetical protein
MRRAWWIAGLGLVASCGQPAAESGETKSQAEPPAAAPAPGQVELGRGQLTAPQEFPPSQAAAQPLAATQPARPAAPDPILAAQQAVPVSEEQDVPVPGELRLAMEQFAGALREHDPSRVLGKFSRAGGFRYADTRKSKPSIQPIAFDRLERELNAKGALYRALLDPAGLAQYVSADRAIPWLGIGPDEFAPRRVDAKKVWVRWRVEGDTWVVDTIALPAALPR